MLISVSRTVIAALTYTQVRVSFEPGERGKQSIHLDREPNYKTFDRLIRQATALLFFVG